MLIEELKPEHLSEYAQVSATWDYYTGRPGIDPSTYLEYARRDAEESDEPRSRINAVGNAKRAFHLQVERLCDAFGWKKFGKRRNPSFGTRLDYLGQRGHGSWGQVFCTGHGVTRVMGSAGHGVTAGHGVRSFV